MRVATASASSSHTARILEMDKARNVVMARNQPPELATDHSDTTSVAPTPMFLRYCTWIGDELRRKHSDMSTDRC